MAELPVSPAPSFRAPGYWPAALILGLMWLTIGATYLSEPGIPQFMLRVMGAPFGGLLALLVWWLFFVRAPWTHKAIPIAAAALVGTAVMLAKSGNAMMYLFGFVPFMVTAWLGWIALTTRMPWRGRLVGLVVVIVATIGFFGLLRIEGLDGSFAAEYHWAWTPTPEQQVLAFRPKDANTARAMAIPKDLNPSPDDWPAFRGAARDGIVADAPVATDWKFNPPTVHWKQPIGPGWSSFALFGDMLFTQEQRGEDELVVCYDAKSGSQVWTFAVPTRFSEAVAGPGPRATPTYHDGKILSQGANGHLVCLDPFSGKLFWKRDLRDDTGAPVPTWGFSASPLVHNGLVSVFAGAKDKTLASYLIDNGELAWTSSRPTSPEQGYCSAHLATIDGVAQILILTDQGATAYDPSTGTLLWEHLWQTGGIVRCIQPALVGASDLLIGTGLGVGTQRIRIERNNGRWSAREIWKTSQFKPYYNDMVVHQAHAYGFDNNFLCCVDLTEGTIRWKARGYGSGQAVLLARQGLLLIVTEKGELALVKASPAAHTELAKFKVIDGKTWNHPIVSRGRVYLRNGQEMACVELPKPAATPVGPSSGH